MTLSACNLDNLTHERAAETAEQWAEAFFHANFERATQYVTPDSRRWLQFAASNITQHEVDLLNATDAEVEVEDIVSSDQDTLVTAVVKVNNYVAPALLGQQSAVQQEGIFSVTLVEHDGKWLVRMADLPQNEKRSHASD